MGYLTDYEEVGKEKAKEAFRDEIEKLRKKYKYLLKDRDGFTGECCGYDLIIEDLEDLIIKFDVGVPIF